MFFLFMFALSKEFIYNNSMEFYQDKNLINFEQFSELFPDEAQILKDSLDLQFSFQIEGKVLKLDSPYSNPVSIDAANKLDYHKKHFYKKSIYKEPLARALGLKKGMIKPHVLDATAGMMGDSLLMFAMGVKVDICERNPIAAALCANSIKNHNLDIKINFCQANEISFDGDVIYFDPMYAQKNDKTKPKKEMQIFRDVVGVDLDAYETALALKSQTSRLVIKRSIKADPLLENPSLTVNGKSTSYDVYITQ